MDTRVNRLELLVSESGTTRFFTIEQADRTLCLVHRICGDIVAQFARLQKLRVKQAARREHGGDDAEATELARQDEKLVDTLTGLQEELRGIGCELKDWATGLVDFPSLVDGRRVWLCWKPGEERITHWHEWNEGFAGRKPTAGLFQTLA